MASIQKRFDKFGNVCSYKVQVRRKGKPNIFTSFPTLTEATNFCERVERDGIYPKIDKQTQAIENKYVSEKLRRELKEFENLPIEIRKEIIAHYSDMILECLSAIMYKLDL